MSDSTPAPEDRLGRKVSSGTVVAERGFKRRTVAPYLRTKISLTDRSLHVDQARALLGLFPIGRSRWRISVECIEGIWDIRTRSVRRVILGGLLVLLGLAGFFVPGAPSLPVWMAPSVLVIGLFSMALSPKQAIEIVDVAGDRKRYDLAYVERNRLSEFSLEIAGAIVRAQDEGPGEDVAPFLARARKRRLVRRSGRLMLGAIAVLAIVGAYQYFDIPDAGNRFGQWATEQMRNLKSDDGRWGLVPPPGRSLDTIDPNETPSVITPAQLPHLTPISFPQAGTYPGFESTVGVDAFLDGDPSAQVEPRSVISGYLVGKEKQPDGSHLFAVEVPFLNGQVFDGVSASSTVDCGATTTKPGWDLKHEVTESLAGGVIVWLSVYPAINTSWYPLETAISYGTDAFEENGGAQGPDVLYDYAKIGDPIRATVDLGMDLESASMHDALNDYVASGHAVSIAAARAQIQNSLARSSAALRKLMSDCRTSVSLTDQLAGKRYVVSPSGVAFLPRTSQPPSPGAGTLDQANDPTIWNTYGAASGNGTTAFAQTFTAGLTGKLPQIDLYLRSDSQSAGTSAMTVSIWRTDKSGLPAGSAIATSTPVSVAGQRWYEFSFSSPATVAAGTSYAIVFSPSDGIEATGSYVPYRGGQALFERSGWQPNGANGQPTAFLFRTYVDSK
jgi:hypothetical protein